MRALERHTDQFWFSGGDIMTSHPNDGIVPMSIAAAGSLHLTLTLELLDAARRGDDEAVTFLKREETDLRLAIQARRDWRRAA